MLDVVVTKNPEQHRYEGWADGELVGFITYIDEGEVVVLPHTEVDPKFRGQQVGSQLVEQTVNAIRSEGRLVDPQCPFVREWIDKHPSFAEDLA